MLHNAFEILTQVVESGIVDGSALVSLRSFLMSRCNDFVLSLHGLVRRQHADLASSDFLLVNVDDLQAIISLTSTIEDLQ